MSETYSFSKINTYRTCPVQYEAKYVTKSVKFQETAATKWGSEVHKAAEDLINDGKPLTDRYDLLTPYAKIINSMEGTKQAEVELAVTADLKPCGFWSKSAWLRGKIDYRCMQGDRAIQWDWKTGKAKPNDFEEMRCFSALTFLNEPEVEKTKNIYIWLKGDSKPTSEVLERKQIDELLEPLQATIDRIENSMSFGEFKPKPSGLCGQWCDVVSCKHNGRNK